MPLIDLTLRHGQTLEEARRRLEIAVNEVNTRFASMIRRTEWAVDRNRVKVEGAGWFLDSQFVSGLKQIVERTFQKKLPP